jgi:flavodoxin
MEKGIDALPFRTLIVLHSYHHHNTAKVADVIAGVLGAQILAAQEADSEALGGYDLIGFGSGIDSGKHYEELLEMAERLPENINKKSFIFSTSAIVNADKMSEDHSCLRIRLVSKGYSVLGEFSCKGFNTNAFLKYFGGMNRGRPNDEDLRRAGEFAQSLKTQMTDLRNDHQ